MSDYEGVITYGKDEDEEELRAMGVVLLGRLHDGWQRCRVPEAVMPKLNERWGWCFWTLYPVKDGEA